MHTAHLKSISNKIQAPDEFQCPFSQLTFHYNIIHYGCEAISGYFLFSLKLPHIHVGLDWKNVTVKRAIAKCCLIVANNDCLVTVFFLNLTMEFMNYFVVDCLHDILEDNWAVSSHNELMTTDM